MRSSELSLLFLLARPLAADILLQPNPPNKKAKGSVMRGCRWKQEKAARQKLRPAEGDAEMFMCASQGLF